MKTQILWLRVSYWTGAIADGYATYLMLFPKISAGVEYRYALGMAASLMLGWTFLLIWADRKPLARRTVLLLTAFPVVSGILLADVYAIYSGLISFEKALPSAIFLMVLIILFSYSYFNARNLEGEEKI